jgi:hypothetical protein
MSVVHESIPLLVLVSLLGCTDDLFGFTSDGGDESTDTGDPPPDPPREGFRVFPRYLLLDVPAVVTLDLDGTPEPCPYDDVGGGYVCDATGFNGGPLTLMVERDGFDTAIRHPYFYAGVIEEVLVHLSPLGGPTGVWSACLPAGAFATCGDVCVDQMGMCVPASCATADPESPIATLETYLDAECGTAIENQATTCDTPLPIAPAGSLRCCCGT